MQLTEDFLQEVELLLLYDPDGAYAGIKIHHEADSIKIAAAKRLFAKNIITLEDGGFLTTLGITAAEHAQALVTMLRTD